MAEADGNRTRLPGSAGTPVLKTGGPTRRPDASAGKHTNPGASIFRVDQVDVVVVGAGVMGTAAARSLGERGIETLLLEQFRVGHARGSSHGPSRIFRLSYPQPHYVELAKRALECWTALEAAAGEALLIRTGGLDAGSIARECAGALRASGVEHQWMSREQASERFPELCFDGLEPILHQEDAGVCLADRTVAAQLGLARRAGVEVREDTTVSSLALEGNAVRLDTDSGAVAAKTVVVTAGPWAGGLLREFGIRAYLQPVLQHVSYFGVPTEQPGQRLPTLIEWKPDGTAWYAVPPVPDAQALKVARHAAGPPVDPSLGPFPVDPGERASHERYVRLRFPGLSPQALFSETCLYTMSRDEDFLIDRNGPIVLAAGFSGHGFKFAPLVGEILADMALGGIPNLPPSVFSLRRLTLP